MKLLVALLLAALAVIVSALAFFYSGLFNIAADVPHSAFTYRMLEAVRDRSIAVRAAHIDVPSLDAPQLIANGARDYAEMCAACHLAPDRQDSELRDGLYPTPPKLTEHTDATPAEMFWVIKHGIKMSAMPAWGPTHSDERIWGMVAFVRRLPELTPEQYQTLAGPNRAADHEHHHHP